MPLALQHFVQIGVRSSNRKSLTHRPQHPATKKLNSTPERSLLCATGSSKTTGSGEAGEAGNSTKTEDLADVITRAARSADDRTAGKSSTTNRLSTFRMLAYGPPGGNLGRSRATPGSTNPRIWARVIGGTKATSSCGALLPASSQGSPFCVRRACVGVCGLFSTVQTLTPLTSLKTLAF